MVAHIPVYLFREKMQCLCSFSPHFGLFLWPFVESVSLCWVIEHFCCLHVFDIPFVSIRSVHCLAIFFEVKVGYFCGQ